MLQNWLKPLPPTSAKEAEASAPNSFGNKATLHRESLPDLRKTKIALVGLSEKDTAEIRRHLYRMAWPFPENTMADLGNIRKTDPSFLVPLLFELLSSKILPILIGGKDEHAPTQFLAYQEAKSLVNLAVVDEGFRFSSDKPEALKSQTPATHAYNNILSPRNPMLFHFGLIGFQSHQVQPAALDFLEKNNFDAFRLGKTRQNIEETEPLIRDADLLAFHLSALKQSEAPGVAAASPSGFFSEEACQICRYAGMSDKLTSFGIYGYQKDADRDAQTAQITAQMVWYFIEGFFNRKKDFPVSTDGLTEYIVDLPALQYQITFWKSIKSGRWWMEAPVASKRKLQRHRLVPCSYQDYQAAVREELPERLIQAFARFG